MTSLIKICFFTTLLALPAMANATFFNQHHGNDFAFGEQGAFSWSRTDGNEKHGHELLEHLLGSGSERPSIWGQWEYNEPRILPKLILGLASLFKHIDFNSPRHGWDWSHCETTEVPVPAALPLFTFALVSLGLFKRRGQKV